jgi:ribulose-phosphate 3-epimerase
MVKISPSILSADLSNLEREIKDLEQAGADMIHIDVMDGHFVPNLTFGPGLINAIRKHTKLPFDVHLMIDEPEKYIQDYVNAGADFLTIHPEATKHLDRTLKSIKDMGAKAGISLLPTATTEILDYILDDISLILVMTVNPGFGGQKFMHNQLDKIRKLAELIKDKDIYLSVDGGITDETSALCRKAGANMLVSGSYIFKGNYAEQIKNLGI